MNVSEQNDFAKFKLAERIQEREVQIKAKIESIQYRLNEYVQGGLAGIDEKGAKVLMDDLVQLMADYRKVLTDLKALGG